MRTRRSQVSIELLESTIAFETEISRQESRQDYIIMRPTQTFWEVIPDKDGQSCISEYSHNKNGKEKKIIATKKLERAAGLLFPLCGWLQRNGWVDFS